jgi:hypothetical protein
MPRDVIEPREREPISLAHPAMNLNRLTVGDSRFDLAVGGKSWSFYPIERLGGIAGHRDISRGWMQRHNLRPGTSCGRCRKPINPRWSRSA